MIQILSSSGRSLGVACSLPFVRCCARTGIDSEIVSQPFLPVSCLSFIQYTEVTQIVSGFFSEGIALCVAVHLIHLWEEEIPRVS